MGLAKDYYAKTGASSYKARRTHTTVPGVTDSATVRRTARRDPPLASRLLSQDFYDEARYVPGTGTWLSTIHVRQRDGQYRLVRRFALFLLPPQK